MLCFIEYIFLKLIISYSYCCHVNLFIQMRGSTYEFRSDNLITVNDDFEKSLLKRTVLRQESPIVGVFYSFFIKKGEFCQMRTMEYGSLTGCVKSVLKVVEEKEHTSVITNVICTSDDVKSLRRPECDQVFQRRHDDIKALTSNFRSFGDVLSCDSSCHAGALFMVIDLGGKRSLEVCQHVAGKWHTSNLFDEIRTCFSDVLESEVKENGFNLSRIASNTDSLEAWEIGNCLPNFDTSLQSVKDSSIANRFQAYGKHQVWKVYSMKNNFLLDWHVMTIDECLANLLDTSSGNEFPSRSTTFKKLRKADPSAVEMPGEKIFPLFNEVYRNEFILAINLCDVKYNVVGT